MPELITPNSLSGLNITLELYSSYELQDSVDQLVEEHAKLNSAAFALQDPTTPEQAQQNLEAADLYIKARASDNAVGFAAYQSIESDMGIIIYQSRGLLEQSRGLGLGRIFARIAASSLNAHYLMAKAQNPISIWSTMQSGLFSKVYPIDSLYDTSAEMSDVLDAVVTQRKKHGQVDMRTGLHVNSYPMGKLGDYQAPTDHPGITRVSSALSKIGLNAANGDAVYYGGRVEI